MPRYLTILAALSFAGDAAAQSIVGSRSALAHVPYWWSTERIADLELIPLVWLNEIDGGSTGCCVIGAAGRSRLGPSTLWLGLGFGTAGEGGQPAAIEAAVELANGALAFRKLHGRNGFALSYVVLPNHPEEGPRLTLEASTLWMDDSRYLPPIVLFDCPAGAPSAPCAEVETAYPWSEGRDNSLGAGIQWGSGVWGAPLVAARADVGLEVANGEHSYLRGEIESSMEGPWGPNRWTVRLAGGWASGDAPMQRRFLLEGADPITRWLNPYLDARGALLDDVPYFVPGGPHLRAYEETRPLIKAYLGFAGELSRAGMSESGFWGRGALFAEAAITPGLPATVGRADFVPEADILFDWERLPSGQGSEQGQFRAGVLSVPGFWADAGVSFAGGYDRLAVTVAFPLLISEPGFAGDPILGGERKTFGLRWSLSIALFAEPVRL